MKNKVFIICEAGINHNGDLNIAKQLIKATKEIGADAIKFQKRTIDKVYTKEFLDSPRNDNNPYGWTTQRQQKEGLEFGKNEYDEIDKYCKEIDIKWFASAWDIDAQLFLRQYNLKYNKIASAMLTNLEFLKVVASENKYTFISTGMSVFSEIDEAVKIFKSYECPFELMHCNSSYPSLNKDANLKLIEILKHKYGVPVGYSSHEVGRIAALSSIALGASSIEKHITLDNKMYGSDQSSSLPIEDMKKLIIDIRGMEEALDVNIEKVFSESELKVRKKLRGI